MSILINNYIDCCIGTNGSHYDIAKVIYEIIKDTYMYNGNNIWSYKENNIWIVDDKNNYLKNEIKTNVNNYFIGRAIYWSQQSKEYESINISISIDNQIKASRILQYSNKLKDNKFIFQIIKELKQFYSIFDN